MKRILQESPAQVIILGGGLAGSECSWQLAEAGIKVLLIEQRPIRGTHAHTTPLLGELVCSNSFKSTEEFSAPQLLKEELEKLSSLVLKCAMRHRVPAGMALSVDRTAFAQDITRHLGKHPNIQIHHAAVNHFEELLVSGPQGLRPVVIATGPLTDETFSASLQKLIGDQLYFYDAIAPIIDGSTINRSVVWAQNRYDKTSADSLEEGDYLNCPMSEQEYANFIAALTAGEKLEAHSFEKLVYFQGCQPIEAMLERGHETLRFGPMKPVGLRDPRTNQSPHAVVQLRREDNEGRAYNMVGFQTKLKYPEQKRIFRMIPGLENAEFFRLGSLHRNTFILSPAILNDQFGLKSHPLLHFAGQITGVEGYLESTALGALVGRLLTRRLQGDDRVPIVPPTTAIGALAHAVLFGKVKNFQPMNINWGLFPLLEINERDPEKKQKLTQRARRNFSHWAALF